MTFANGRSCCGLVIEILLSSGLVDDPDQADPLANNFRIGRIHGPLVDARMRSKSLRDVYHG